MSTRLKCQEVIKNFFGIQNVRLCPVSNKQHEITIYFEDNNGIFNEALIPQIKEILPCHLFYSFKPYSEIINDNIPVEPILPELIENLALKTTGNLNSYRDVVQRALAELMPFEIHISMPESVIGIKTSKHLSPNEFAKYTLYAQEVAPIGCYVSILCK